MAQDDYSRFGFLWKYMKPEVDDIASQLDDICKAEGEGIEREILNS